MMSRAEHLQWAKDRAIDELDAGSVTDAVVSMISDLGKHGDLAPSQTFAAITGLMYADTSDRAEVRRWIEGFN